MWGEGLGGSFGKVNLLMSKFIRTLAIFEVYSSFNKMCGRKQKESTELQHAFHCDRAGET